MELIHTINYPQNNADKLRKKKKKHFALYYCSFKLKLIHFELIIVISESFCGFLVLFLSFFFSFGNILEHFAKKVGQAREVFFRLLLSRWG